MFHNSNLFGSCIIHILYTGCAKIKKIIPAPKVNKYCYSLTQKGLSCYNKKTHKYSVGRAYSCWMLNILMRHVTSSLWKVNLLVPTELHIRIFQLVFERAPHFEVSCLKKTTERWWSPMWVLQSLLSEIVLTTNSHCFRSNCKVNC